MSNHVHYLIEPRRPDELPRVMHWLNWYTAMGLNRLLGRRGHFWEARYHASWVSNRNQRHVLNVLRYIHGNPFAAGIAPGFRHEFTNYGSYASGTADGITTWHPQFLRLGRSLEECAVRYRRFCRRYRPADKPESRSIGWGGRSLLGGLMGEMARKTSFGRHASRGKATGLFDDLEDRVVGRVSVLRDDAIDHRRRRSGRVMSMISPVDRTLIRRPWCQVGRQVALAPSEDDHGSKIPSGRSIGCFVWPTARCVATLRMYRGRKPHLLTDFLSG